MGSACFAGGKELIAIGGWLRAGNPAHFFEQINLFSRGFEKVRRLVEEEKFDAALKEYRELLKKRLPASAPAYRAAPEKNFQEKADLLLKNRVSLLGSRIVDLGDPIDWFLEPDGDKQWQSHLGYFYFTNCLLDAYEATGQEQYLDKWMEIYEDFLQHHYWGVHGLEYDVSLPAYLNEKGYKYGGEGRTPGYLGGSWIGLAAASRMECMLQALGRVAGDERVPDILIANILYSLVTDHFFVVLNNARRYTPNQFIHCACALVYLGRVLDEFKIAPAAYLVGMDRLEEAVDMCVLPDGTDLEQSFNYNHGLVARLYEISRLFEGTRNLRMEKLREKAEQRCLFLASLITPLDQMPAVAKTHQGNHAVEEAKGRNRMFPLPRTGEIIRAIEKQERCTVNSAAYPYGGYYVMRSGWTKKDNYLFFKTSRYGMGHAHEDCNSVILTALGQNLLVDAGNYNYADDPASKRLNEYFTSSFAHSTLCVDGLSQCRLKTVAVNRDKVSEDWREYEEYAAHLRRLQKRDGTRFHFGRLLQFAEGIYNDGYGEQRLDAVHHRQVYSIGNQCYVIADRISGGSSFQLNWMLSPECGDTSFQEGTILTHAGDVTLEILHLGGKDLSFRLEKGQEDPVSGWMCTDYNRKTAAEHVSVTWKDRGGQLMVSLLMPYRDKRPEVEVTVSTNERVGFTVSQGRLTAECLFEKGGSRISASLDGRRESLLLSDEKNEFTDQEKTIPILSEDRRL